MLGRKLWIAMAGVLAAGFVASAQAASPLDQVTARELRRQDAFVALQGGEAREYYQGQAFGGRVLVNSFGSTVSGQGPAGQLSLWYTGNSINGSSAGRPVNLSALGGSVSGFGPRGAVSLWVSGTMIYGRVGDFNVSVSVMGGFASGSIGNYPFTLQGFDNLQPVAVAGLLGAL